MTTSDFSEHHEQRDFVFICPSNLECVLAVGDATDIEALQEWCSTLPLKSYGRVFIEVESPLQIAPITAPPGVGITWVSRMTTASQPGTVAVRAANGWLDEWLRGDPMSGRYVQLWDGMRENPVLAEAWQRFEAELSETFARAAEFRDQSA